MDITITHFKYSVFNGKTFSFSKMSAQQGFQRHNFLGQNLAKGNPNVDIPL